MKQTVNINIESTDDGGVELTLKFNPPIVKGQQSSPAELVAAQMLQAAVHPAAATTTDAPPSGSTVNPCRIGLTTKVI